MWPTQGCRVLSPLLPFLVRSSSLKVIPFPLPPLLHNSLYPATFSCPTTGYTRKHSMSDWSEAKDGEGRTYYFNSKTQATSWEKPAEMSTGGWAEVKTEDGKVYYHNAGTGATQWDPPPGFAPATPAAAAAAAPQAAKAAAPAAAAAAPSAAAVVPKRAPTAASTAASSGPMTTDEKLAARAKKFIAARRQEKQRATPSACECAAPPLYVFVMLPHSLDLYMLCSPHCFLLLFCSLLLLTPIPPPPPTPFLQPRRAEKDSGDAQVPQWCPCLCGAHGKGEHSPCTAHGVVVCSGPWQWQGVLFLRGWANKLGETHCPP